MSEPISAERKLTSAAHDPPEAAALLHAAGGVALRVDRSHVRPESDDHDGLETHDVDDAAACESPAADGDASFPERFAAGGASDGFPAGEPLPHASRLKPHPPAGASDGPPAGEPVDFETPDPPSPLQLAQLSAHLRQQHVELDRREQRLHTQLAQLDEERRETRMWAAELESGLQEREFGIGRQEAALAQRAEACVQLETELKQLHESLLRERQSLNTEREQFVIDRESDRRELDELQTRQRHELDRQRQDAQAEIEQERGQLQQEKVLLDNRHRFQQEHLRRSMQEFEVQQAEFRREQQLGRTRLDEVEVQNQHRSRQLSRLRDLLEERQRSVEREREVLTRERRIVEERQSADRGELSRERAAWEEERDAQRADLRRQQDMLALHAENLETRRQRLDRLRAELEETNRQTLELRLAVEESYAQLTQTAGAEATQRKVEDARTVLAEYYRHTRDSLVIQRQELEQIQTRLEEQRGEFRQERQSLVEWIGRQEEQLTRREADLEQQTLQLASHEQKWRASADRWTQEKLQAETVIRDLLKQLADRESA